MSEGKFRLGVLTHHKCASTFTGRYLERFCELNALKLYWYHSGSALPLDEYDISFLTNATYQPSYSDLECPILHIIRNPLDIIVSAYYSHLRTHSLAGWPQLERQRRILAGCTKEAGLFLTLAFLELEEFYPQTPGPLCALRGWKFDDESILTLRMEDLTQNIGLVLGPILRDTFGAAAVLPDPQEHSFERMSGGRRPGDIDNSSHYRSGVPGRWRSELPRPIVDYIEQHFSDVLRRYYPESCRELSAVCDGDAQKRNPS